MFTCGPSIYQRPHIGNYRTFLFEDVLQRYLEYIGYNVIRTLNFTDVEDKSIAEADRKDMEVLELTGKAGKDFFKDLKKLNIKKPTYNPRSSTSIEQAVELIQTLLEKEHAYWYKGNVYFDLMTFKDFGKLGHLDRSKFPKKRIRYHRDTYSGNRRNVGDFILWHGYKQGDTTYWDTPLGKGRPAWNVQDPAMAIQTLGPCVDICCGGEDSLARHHDYTIAVAEAYSEKELARYWLHGAHLLVDGKKMSKSKGNVIYVDELVKAGYSGEEIRFFLIYANYRQRLNFTYENLKKNTEKLRKTRDIINTLSNVKGSKKGPKNSISEKLVKRMERDFKRNMDNDLDVKTAFDGITDTLLKIEEMSEEGKLTSQDAEDIIEMLKNMDSVLQVLGLAEP